MGWPSKHDRVLQALFASGLSFAQISARMLAEYGVWYSRNACIGRAQRLKLAQADRPKARRERPETPKPWEANGTSKRTYYRHKQAATVALKPKPEPRQFACDAVTGLRVADVVPLHLHLLELKPDQCRYPYGRSRYTFCGNPIFGETSYCEPHLSLCLRAVA